MGPPSADGLIADDVATSDLQVAATRWIATDPRLVDEHRPAPGVIRKRQQRPCPAAPALWEPITDVVLVHAPPPPRPLPQPTRAHRIRPFPPGPFGRRPGGDLRWCHALRTARPTPTGTDPQSARSPARPRPTPPGAGTRAERPQRASLNSPWRPAYATVQPCSSGMACEPSTAVAHALDSSLRSGRRLIATARRSPPWSRPHGAACTGQASRAGIRTTIVSKSTAVAPGAGRSSTPTRGLPSRDPCARNTGDVTVQVSGKRRRTVNRSVGTPSSGLSSSSPLRRLAAKGGTR